VIGLGTKFMKGMMIEEVNGHHGVRNGKSSSNILVLSGFFGA